MYFNENPAIVETDDIDSVDFAYITDINGVKHLYASFQLRSDANVDHPMGFYVTNGVNHRMLSINNEQQVDEFPCGHADPPPVVTSVALSPEILPPTSVTTTVSPIISDVQGLTITNIDNTNTSISSEKSNEGNNEEQQSPEE